MLRKPRVCGLKKLNGRGAQVARSVKHLTLDLSSGLRSLGRGFNPHVGLHAGPGAHLKKKKVKIVNLMLCVLYRNVKNFFN